MLFSSSLFLFIFLPAVTLLYFALPKKRWAVRNLLLFLLSIVFYWCGEPRLVVLMLFSIGANWLFGLWAGTLRAREKSARPAVVLAVCVNVGVLFVFKYLSFLTRQLNILAPSLPVVDIALPIGISFYTFQAMSYVFDVSSGEVEPEKNPLNVGLYISFFPQLIAGPIIKYSTYAPQIRDRVHSWDKFSRGMERFAQGLCKKVLLANTLAYVADAAFASAAPGASLALLGLFSYALQLYYDFSGYSDMAIGLALMFGFEFPENFTHPYMSVSITEYWARWHITLGEWFRDYVLYPVSRSRLFMAAGKKLKARWGRGAQKVPSYVALFIVWFLTGLWHGANWTFVLFGLFHYVFIALEKLININKRRNKPLRWLYTMAVVLLAMVLFRSDSVANAGRYYLSLVGANGFSDVFARFFLRENWLYLLAGTVFCMPVEAFIEKRVKSRPVKAFLLDGLKPAVLFVLFAASVTYIIKGTYNPFIYFNF